MNYLNGYVIFTYKNFKITEKVNGFREVYPQKKIMKKNTYFDIASLTKTYTATLVYICYEEKGLSLDMKITEIDKDFKNLSNISILDLLCHNQEIWTDGYLGDCTTIEEYQKVIHTAYVKSIIPKYVDIHYIILGLLLEKIYGKSLDILFEEKIFKKLELNETKFKVIENIASTNYENYEDNHLKIGELHDQKARNLSKLNIITGHASIFCTAGDLLKFLASFFSDNLLKKETIEIMLSHHDLNKYNKNNNMRCRTYNFMGARYYNEIESINDVPKKGKIISFSGFTGPRYLIDFDKKIIIVLMCSCVHYTKMTRSERFDLTKEIVFNEYFKIINTL